MTWLFGASWRLPTTGDALMAPPQARSQRTPPRGASTLPRRLDPIVPNPTPGAARVSFALPAAADAQVTVYGLAGNRIRTLAGGRLDAGSHALRWDGRSDAGRSIAPGLYFVRVEVGGMRLTRPLVVLNWKNTAPRWIPATSWLRPPFRVAACEATSSLDLRALRYRTTIARAVRLLPPWRSCRTYMPAGRAPIDIVCQPGPISPTFRVATMRPLTS